MKSHGVWGGHILDPGRRQMREGTPDYPRYFHLFGLLINTAPNCLQTQVYQAHIAGPDLTTIQVSAAKISWRLGGQYHRSRPQMDEEGTPDSTRNFHLFRLLINVPSPQFVCCSSFSKMSSNKRTPKHAVGSKGSKTKKQLQSTLVSDGDEILKGLNKAHMGNVSLSLPKYYIQAEFHLVKRIISFSTLFFL